MKPNIELTPSAGTSELIIREGKAIEPPKPNESILINGTLAAPFQFLSGKKGLREDIDIHLKIFNDLGRLELVIGDQDPDTTHVISGTLTKDKALESFCINSEKRWGIREFIKFAKMMRFYFADKVAHTKLIESLQKWSVKVEKVVVDHNDHKGNSNFQLEHKVKEVEGFISKFDLSIPIFQGYEKLLFTVEIGLDPKNATVDLFLISDELFELEISYRENLIRQELQKFDSWSFSKVVIS